MVGLDGRTSMVQFIIESIYKAFGPLTRCKPNADQEERPCTRIVCVDPFNICQEKGSFEHKNQFWQFSSFLFPQNISLKIYYNISTLANFY